MANKYIAYVAGFLEEIEATEVSTGVAEAGDLVALNSTGTLDTTLISPLNGTLNADNNNITNVNTLNGVPGQTLQVSNAGASTLVSAFSFPNGVALILDPVGFSASLLLTSPGGVCGYGCTATRFEFQIPAGSDIALNGDPGTAGFAWLSQGPGNPPVYGQYDFGDLANVPATFPPSPHNHVVADITDFNAGVSANPDVAANTAARHPAATPGDTAIAIDGSQVVTLELSAQADNQLRKVGDGLTTLPRSGLTLPTTDLFAARQFMVTGDDGGLGVDYTLMADVATWVPTGYQTIWTGSFPPTVWDRRTVSRPDAYGGAGEEFYWDTFRNVWLTTRTETMHFIDRGGITPGSFIRPIDRNNDNIDTRNFVESYRIVKAYINLRPTLADPGDSFEISINNPTASIATLVGTISGADGVNSYDFEDLNIAVPDGELRVTVVAENGMGMRNTEIRLVTRGEFTTKARINA